MKKLFVNHLIIAVAIVISAAFVTSCGKDGKDGKPGEKGEQGIQGDKGEPGANAVITISEDGFWVINGVKTNVRAEGPQGDTPTVEINADGYWVINGVETDVKAEGTQGEQGNDGKNSYLVIFDSNGGMPLFRIIGVKHGDKITAPSIPVYTGFVFDGWYKDETFTDAWDFDNDIVTDNITLFAKWIAEGAHFVNITDEVLKNTKAPFETEGDEEIGWPTSCLFPIADWIANAEAAKGGNVHLDFNKYLALLTWDGYPSESVSNGKLYQTVELEAGTYRFDVEAFSFWGIPDECYIVAALGDDLPDVVDVEDQSLGFDRIYDGETTYSFTFELSEKSTVSIGFVANLGANQWMRFVKVELFKLL